MATSAKVLGSNPLGAVYGAIYQKRRVAVKRNLIDALSDCHKATDILQLEHENIVKILKVDDLLINNCFFRCFVLELCTGTLEDYFHGRYEALPKEKMPEDLDALSQMAKGVSFMHSKNVFHGAIKPCNISISIQSSIIPQVILKVSQDSLMTWTKGSIPSHLIGFDSYIYWPPEWLAELEDENIPQPTAAADIFALGCVFYGYISKGNHPFGKGIHMLFNILNNNQLKEISSHAASQLIWQMIQADPMQRPQVKQVAEMIAGFSKQAKKSQINGKPMLLGEVNEHNHYMTEFRVNQCEDFLTERGCSNSNCFNYHHPNQRRRRSFLMKDGSLNYSCTYQCLLYDITTGECVRGDNCPLLHNNVGGTERRYHLSTYKTEMCSKADCSNPHCSFAHGKSDLRTPVFSKGDPRVQEQSHETVMPASLIMKNHSLWQNPDYVVNNYKTRACATSYEQCTLKATCPYHHASQERRRSLKLFSYGSQPCPLVFDPSGEWKDPALCRNGDACRYCHTKKEFMYHILNYKTADCSFRKSGSCKRGHFCAFAHDNEKRRPKQFQENESSLKNLKSYLQLA